MKERQGRQARGEEGVRFCPAFQCRGGVMTSPPPRSPGRAVPGTVGWLGDRRGCMFTRFSVVPSAGGVTSGEPPCVVGAPGRFSAGGVPVAGADELAGPSIAEIPFAAI